MIIEQRIKNFEKLGFGMFVHFGLYSVGEKGEYLKREYKLNHEDYLEATKSFNPKKDWAEELVLTAKNAGCKYITLTSRHHDGFSLYDTCGLNDYDAVHICGRDLVKEFVDACNKHDIIPFLYHTLIDWYEESFNSDFPKYLKYLRDSVEIICKNYGKIGGYWFDGTWGKPKADWEEDALYSLIRSYQPDAMIINNTGMVSRGALGHIELDSVTFERGRPKPINMEGSPKYVASEMCEVFASHWGFAKNDLRYKSVPELIESLAICRRYHSNLLLNVGPMADGSIRLLDRGILEVIGMWTKTYSEAIYDITPTDIEIENRPKDFILKGKDDYYLFAHNLTVVVLVTNPLWIESISFNFDKKIKSISWVESGEELEFTQEGDRVTVKATPYKYGENLVVRVAKIEVE